MTSSVVERARTITRLGLANVARVASYRLRLRAGIHPVQRLPLMQPPAPPFFRAPLAPATETPASRGSAAPFGWLPAPVSEPPRWHANVITGVQAASPDVPWWRLPDFDPQLGDIKTVWEASRFDWVMTFAQDARTGDPLAIERLNRWLGDWATHNPTYLGHNWKCAQEASIRVMHLAVAALLLGQVEDPEPGLVAMLTAHLRRIAPTVAYAMAQDNNHGTSEAAALVIGGSWLERLGERDAAGWHRSGRRLLADRARRLIGDDGSFSQHSVTYHRLALDTLSLAEVWRRRLGLAPFDAIVTERASTAMEWLRSLVEPETGDAPNLGANDGANLLPLTDAGYRDFRPAVQLAASLFADRAAYAPGPWNDQLIWLGVEPANERLPRPSSRLFRDGGYAVLHRPGAIAVLRYPRYRFRPAHADALHVDLTVNGENLLRDGGTFSYVTDPATDAAFTGAAGHNTVQLDEHEQMPRLGRFLWGDWLRPASADPVVDAGALVTAGASYRDRFGAWHGRRVVLEQSSLTVHDDIGGITNRAVLRWRLRPGAWTAQGHSLASGPYRLSVTSDAPITRFELVTGWESREYLRRTSLPVLEVEIAQPGRITSVWSWDA